MLTFRFKNMLYYGCLDIASFNKRHQLYFHGTKSQHLMLPLCNLPYQTGGTEYHNSTSGMIFHASGGEIFIWKRLTGLVPLM